MQAVRITRVRRVDAETLIPEATDKNVAVVRGDDKALGMDSNTLV